jgi:hypothetical protein
MDWKCWEVSRRKVLRQLQAQVLFTVRVICMVALICWEKSSHRCYWLCSWVLKFRSVSTQDCAGIKPRILNKISSKLQDKNKQMVTSWRCNLKSQERTKLLKYTRLTDRTSLNISQDWQIQLQSLYNCIKAAFSCTSHVASIHKGACSLQGSDLYSIRDVRASLQPSDLTFNGFEAQNWHWLCPCLLSWRWMEDGDRQNEYEILTPCTCTITSSSNN